MGLFFINRTGLNCVMTGKIEYANWKTVYWSVYAFLLCVYFYLSRIDSYTQSEKVDAVVVDKLYLIGEHKKYIQVKFLYKGEVYYTASRAILFRYKRIGRPATVIFPEGEPEQAVIYNFFVFWISVPAIGISFMIAYLLFKIPFLWGQYVAFKREYRNK